MKTLRKQTFSTFWDESFYGAVTVGERGQVVIPSEARSDMEIKAGDKLLVMRHPVHEGLVIAKIDALRDFLDDAAKHLEKMSRKEERGAGE